MPTRVDFRPSFKEMKVKWRGVIFSARVLIEGAGLTTS